MYIYYYTKKVFYYLMQFYICINSIYIYNIVSIISKIENKNYAFNILI